MADGVGAVDEGFDGEGDAGAFAGVEGAVGIGDGRRGETDNFLPGVGDADEFLGAGGRRKAGEGIRMMGIRGLTGCSLPGQGGSTEPGSGGSAPCGQCATGIAECNGGCENASWFSGF